MRGNTENVLGPLPGPPDLPHAPVVVGRGQRTPSEVTALVVVVVNVATPPADTVAGVRRQVRGLGQATPLDVRGERTGGRGRGRRREREQS